MREQVVKMDFFFHPDGIAVIGATDNPMRGGYHILNNTLGNLCIICKPMILVSGQ